MCRLCAVVYKLIRKKTRLLSASLVIVTGIYILVMLSVNASPIHRLYYAKKQYANRVAMACKIGDDVR